VADSGERNYASERKCAVSIGAASPTDEMIAEIAEGTCCIERRFARAEIRTNVYGQRLMPSAVTHATSSGNSACRTAGGSVPMRELRPLVVVGIHQLRQYQRGIQCVVRRQP
jgi:hypothetical protein